MQVIYKAANESTLVQPGQAIEQSVTFGSKDYPIRRFLRVIGGVQMPGRFVPHGVEYFRQAEYTVDDCLDSVNNFRDKFSLYFKGENESFERHAYYRVTGFMYSKGPLVLETVVKRNKLKVAPGGDFGVELQIYFHKEGRYPDDVYDNPDTIMYMPVPQGSGNFKLQKTVFNLPAGVACILLRAGEPGSAANVGWKRPVFTRTNVLSLKCRLFRMPVARTITTIG